MSSWSDLARLRDQAIGASGEEEAVTVNTRALIDKVLARYSSDWTTLRELIQNAADAAAKKVVIRFETLPSKAIPVPSSGNPSDVLQHTLTNHTTFRLTVSNDGQVFNDCDWTRLKRIAEGNPDETKIGAFGVGFYSVFADCEEPFVISGDKTMAFVWKGNSLFTKSGILPAQHARQETCFVLNYRSLTSPVPDLASLCQFLCTSLTFVSLENIDLHIDDWKIMSLSKKSAPGVNIPLPRDIKLSTKEAMMKISEVTQQSTQIDAEWMNVVGWSLQKNAAQSQPSEEYESSTPGIKAVFSRLKAFAAAPTPAKKAAKEAERKQEQEVYDALSATSRGTVFLRISTVNVLAAVSSTFAHELERATKKPPPKSTRIVILTASHDETSASLSTLSGLTASKASELFHSVLPSKNGRIFIGFPTAQTTGLLCHISAPSVIPTVERESIDLNARYVKTWNTEMLRVAGIACRIAYAGEMSALNKRVRASFATTKRDVITDEDKEILDQASHICRQFFSKESTPSSIVGKLIEEAFWDCSVTNTIDVLSTKGVRSSKKTRVVDLPLSFLKEIAVIPPTLMNSEGAGFITKLYQRRLIGEITVPDIKEVLESTPLNEAQLQDFLKWACDQAAPDALSSSVVKDLLGSAVASISSNQEASKAGSTAPGEQRLVVLRDIKEYLSGSRVPPNMPLPPSTIPFMFTRNIPHAKLQALGWEELSVATWFSFLIAGAQKSTLPLEHNITKSAEFAGQALLVLSKCWDHMNQTTRTILSEQTLALHTIMPTKIGMRRPADAYFPTVKLFDDLPVVTGLPRGVKDNVLSALGVRKTLEITVVFERLMGSRPDSSNVSPRKWSFSDLMHYLVSVRDDIPASDMVRLKNTAFCPADIGAASVSTPDKLYKVSELFEPVDVLRTLKLPVLRWPGFYRSNSPEGKFLRSLGLKPFPTVPELVQIMLQAIKEGDSWRYNMALGYYIDMHHEHGYGAFDIKIIRSSPILPVEGKAFPVAMTPSECYSERSAAVMGFPLIDPALTPHALKFGVAPHPPIDLCAKKLMFDPPTSFQEAQAKFKYFATRLSELDNKLVEALGSAFIVPKTSQKDGSGTRMISPKMCFLGDSRQYGDIFDFVNFGDSANAFLLKIGGKFEPNSSELARMVAENPSRILNMIQEDRYLELLKKIAENSDILSKDKTLWNALRSSPCLLSYQELTSSSRKQSEEYDSEELEVEEDDVVRQYSLRKATEVVIEDEIRAYMMFREYLHVAPQNDILERFYADLGVPKLSSLVMEDRRLGHELRDQSEAPKLYKLIAERARVFLHEYPRDQRVDPKWLDKFLVITMVSSVNISYSLRGYPVRPMRERRSATMVKTTKSSHTLCVIPDYDLYQISQCISSLLLKRPKQHDTLALETVLATDLLRLRNKGYNVDRILRLKAIETRIAHEERAKLQAADESRRRAAEQEPSRTPVGTPTQPNKSLPPTPSRPEKPQPESPDSPGDTVAHMPGSFDSPPREPSKRKPSSKMLSGWSDTVTNLFNRPPSTSRPSTPAPPTSTTDISASFSRAVSACKPHSTATLNSAPMKDPEVPEVVKGGYCDASPAAHIHLAGNTAQGVRVYVGEGGRDRAAWLAAHSTRLRAFADVILSLARMMNVNSSVVHIFHDPGATTIAFNKGGALFFNFAFWDSLHAASWERGEARVDALAYWYVTLCHELAHNLVEAHSAAHSFYSESFAAQNFPKLMAAMGGVKQ
ncbi:hypothetical protein EJ06DRAFT_551258 [Trichodelitschia bisporula]|uniref:Sacsin/Nov domain-containing protein n=1 Tax=Trichodelitschia bisporula TaxID=703511 RepID=A0A6G1HN00_9PEZI|nr:hypothetical protein EJ06DRAFT_551258 [Trichodelitschia bisporula]